MNIKQLLPYTWIEVAIAICMLLIIARFYWVKELYELEKSFFVSIGVSESLKYLITVPLAFLYFFSIYKREKKKSNGDPVVSKYVLIFSATSILAAVLYLVIWV